MNRFINLLFLVLFFSCFNKNDNPPNNYLGFLTANDSVNIPFNFNLNDSLMIIRNSRENIYLPISNSNDSIKVNSPFFEDFLMFVEFKDSFSGFYYNKSLKRKIPFFAKPGTHRFNFNNNDYKNFDGKWKMVFNYDDEAFSAELMAIQHKNQISGTVRTETGDYGFMQGVVNGKKISISNFNGYRAYMINGDLDNDTIRGNLYRGNYDVKKFIAYKDIDFKLSDPYGLTKIKKGYENFIFSFKNSDGELVSNSDEKFNEKVNLIQIMGSWCPNCLDESKYLSELSKKYDEIMITSIAFEFANSKPKAINNIKKLKKNLDLSHDILLAQYGSSNKDDAIKKLPSLDTLISYPTLIIVDKFQKVRRIHTGFNGPATGQKYENFKNEFELFLEKLISE
tara:strand:+ start:5718 stop:6902 length:1185 start_codon:yes stop_codon:yes gene_type:complete